MKTSQYWRLSYRADPRALPLADRHYNRQHVGSPQFVPPGRCVVLLSENEDALWVSSWPFAEYTKHAWAGAWVCSCFRNESPILSSELIREAVAVTRYFWEAPPLGMVTFVDTTKTRKKRDPGRCYVRSGWKPCGYTKGGLYTLQQLPEAMPEPMKALGFGQTEMFDDSQGVGGVLADSQRASFPQALPSPLHASYPSIEVFSKVKSRQRAGISIQQ